MLMPPPAPSHHNECVQIPGPHLPVADGRQLLHQRGLLGRLGLKLLHLLQREAPDGHREEVVEATSGCSCALGTTVLLTLALVMLLPIIHLCLDLREGLVGRR